MKLPSDWLEEFPEGVSLDILRELALSHSLLGGKVGLELARLIKADDIRALCLFQIDPGKDWIPEELYHCRQVVGLFSKIESLDIGIDKNQVAMKGFLEAEELCKQSNEIFRKHARGEFCFSPRVESWLYTAQRKIARLLGPTPPTWSELEYHFGKGATTLTKKRMASVREKFRAGVSCSEELLPAAVAVLGELPMLCTGWASALMESGEESWYSIPVTIHDGKVGFVPKDATKARTTVTEPVLNGLAQLAQGSDLKRRLLGVGVDIRDQTRNQILAREGSIGGTLATVDLKSASDTISRELVFHLLPLEWALFYARTRTGHVRVSLPGFVPGRITLEMFSSMGNGITFPLETLIFWSLARAVCSDDETVSVYGDDIILPSLRYSDLIELFTAVGFIVNKKKSFATGPFRESCGSDFYSGIDVRPYFQKEWVSASTLFILHNFYVRNGMPEFAESVLRYIHPSLKIFGPDGYGDGHLLGYHEKRTKARLSRAGYSGYLFDTFTAKGKKDIRPALESDFVLPTYSVYRRSMLMDRDEDSRDFASKVMKEPWNVRKDADTPGVVWESLPYVGLPIGDHKFPDGSVVKAVDLPDPDKITSYKRISIYVLG